MTRYRITVEYDGSGFVGWQRQQNGQSVQESLEEAIFRFCGETVRVFGAGRTDAGVHALGQTAHFDIRKPASASTVRDALNAHLRRLPIAVLEARETTDDFDARFSARRRIYLYRILNRSAPPCLERNRVWHVRRRIDVQEMQEAAQRLVGLHDFTTFRAAMCQAKSPVKTLERLDVHRAGDEIHVHAEARSFLHRQVRNMVGTLELVGAGKWSADDVAAALAACDRAAGGPTAPPGGLYLVKVRYP